ncbi:hypothetical protein HK57_00001 [Aspergillus ustus]|uniref:Zn(2)-C6 fungal-type domain-containing protein n=1 Tax=Aspergillus ustus TaxID=40382 RepID=A0A0C1E5Q4_ASPUT|nr:hypothetical protein HK57_00001 [Aspergillus ustus]
MMSVSLPEGSVAKLRASCDACNESKVRCSQGKPQCARCAKQDILCVYGLSRRSHKDAPRIGASKETQPTSAIPTSPPSEKTSRDAVLSMSPVVTPGVQSHDRMQHATPLPISLPISAPHHRDISTDEAEPFATGMQSPGSHLFPDDLGLAFHQPADFGLPPDSTDSTFMDFTLMSPNVPDSNGFIHYDFPIAGAEADAAACNCISRSIAELASLRSVAGASFNAQLSQLRRVINVSEGCIACHCTTQDEIPIMITSILIGRVIQGLEATLIRTRSSSSASSSTSSTNTTNSSSNSSSVSGTMSTDAPRLSWGELQIDPDEENQLKAHLWLLQFRKLERLIEEFNSSVRRLTGSTSGGHSAFLMACQCIHMWLTQKADVLKSRYHSQVGESLHLIR